MPACFFAQMIRFFCWENTPAAASSMDMAAAPIAALANHPEKRFTDENAWRRHLQTLRFDTFAIKPDPVKIATEAALWGAICDQGLLRDTVIVSDGAGQFRV